MDDKYKIYSSDLKKIYKQLGISERRQFLEVSRDEFHEFFDLLPIENRFSERELAEKGIEHIFEIPVTIKTIGHFSRIVTPVDDEKIKRTPYMQKVYKRFKSYISKLKKLQETNPEIWEYPEECNEK